jgi:hypothetical protein
LTQVSPAAIARIKSYRFIFAPPIVRPLVQRAPAKRFERQHVARRGHLSRGSVLRQGQHRPAPNPRGDQF